MKRLIYMVIIAMTIMTPSCSIDTELNSDSTTVKEMHEYQQLDSTNLRLVVIEDNNLIIINPETNLKESKSNNPPAFAQVWFVVLVLFCGAMIGGLAMS